MTVLNIKTCAQRWNVQINNANVQGYIETIPSMDKNPVSLLTPISCCTGIPGGTMGRPDKLFTDANATL